MRNIKCEGIQLSLYWRRIERKLQEQNRLDTDVVAAVNDECSPGRNWKSFLWFQWKLTWETFHLKSITAKLKFKRIDGKFHKQRSMKFNAKLPAKPYQCNLTFLLQCRKQVLHGRHKFVLWNVWFIPFNERNLSFVLVNSQKKNSINEFEN